MFSRGKMMVNLANQTRNRDRDDNDGFKFNSNSCKNQGLVLSKMEYIIQVLEIIIHVNQVYVLKTRKH